MKAGREVEREEDRRGGGEAARCEDVELVCKAIEESLGLDDAQVVMSRFIVLLL